MSRRLRENAPHGAPNQKPWDRALYPRRIPLSRLIFFRNRFTLLKKSELAQSRAKCKVLPQAK